MRKLVVVVLMAILTLGCDFSFAAARSDTITITVKNQFPVSVVIQVNRYIAGNAKANASLKIKVDITKVPIKIDVWSTDKPRIIATRTYDALAAGQNLIWETGSVEIGAAPPAPAAQPAIEPPPARPANPASAAVQIKPAAPTSSQLPPKNATLTYMKSTTTLSYRGKSIQNRVKTASLQKIERQDTNEGTLYGISEDNAIQVGKGNLPAFYAVAPSQMKRDLSGHLSSDQDGLKPWLDAANKALDGLAHKRQRKDAWAETIPLPSGALGPASIKVDFRANGLPKPDDKWVLVTAETGLISFDAPSEAQGSQVYGRYQGVLVYAPAEDLLLQAAGVFTTYLGQEQFRVEQVHFAANANGEQLIPALNVTNYLNISPAEPPITAEGEIPAWCIQTAHVFDFLHVTIMTAAEGATNPDQQLAGHAASDIRNQSPAKVQAALKEKVAKDYLGKWIAQLMRNIGNPDWSFWLRDAVTLDLTKNFGPGQFPWTSDLNKPLYVSAVKMINGKLYDIKLINDFPAAPQVQATEPVQPSKPATRQPPPDDVKKPQSTVDTINSLLDDLLWPAIALAGGAGAYLLATGSSEDCTAIGGDCFGNQEIEAVYTLIPATCDCPSGSRLTSNSRQETWGGITYNECFCFYNSMKATRGKVK